MGHLIPLEALPLLAGQAGPGGGSPLFTGVLWLVVMLGVLWFLMIRPEQKKRSTHNELIAALKKGDEIILNSGIFAKVIAVEDATVSAEIADKTRIKVLKTSVHGLASQMQATSAPAKGAEASPKKEEEESKAKGKKT